MRRRALSTYRAKRDFTRTAEPSGSGSVLPSEQLRFVIQKHAARRLHFDLRLELDGVFKSWAVTRMPSLDPADKRLAVHVEDHPLDYGDFEGTIPQGEYGGGTVQLWDRGFWAPEGDTSAQRALASGELKFVLLGERLQGRFVLVRLRRNRDGGKRENWLLIKHGKEPVSARTIAKLQADRSVASGRTMAQIAAGRGRAPQPFMTAPAGGTRADAVWRSSRKPSAAAAASDRERNASAEPATRRRSTGAGARRAGARRTAVPAFIAPQLARLVAQPPDGAGWLHEAKLDGYRLQLRVAGGAARLFTRKGLDWSERFATLATEASALPDCIIDGELVAPDERGVPHFSALQDAIARGRTRPLLFYAFDLLHCEGEDLRGEPLSERKARLKRLLTAHALPHVHFVEHLPGNARSVLASACDLGLEGIVSKRADAPYTSGRGDAWLKSKCRAGQEVVIGGWTSDHGELRSLFAGVHRGGRLEYVGRIGTGFGRDVAKRLLARLKRLEVRTSPFAGATRRVARERTLHWVRPELVAEIESAGWTASGHIRQAAFKGLREDKPAAEVLAEEPAKTDATGRPRALRRASARPHAAMPARGAVATRGADVVLGVRLTHPDKPLWPAASGEEPISKRELAGYLAHVGEWMVPHLTGRPCSLVRAPDGIQGQHFFQRHAQPGRGSPFTAVQVSGDRQPYTQIDRVEQLVGAAQMSVVELHPWNNVPGRPELPGRLVFDLDPAPDVDFGQVIRAALELRERLEALGLHCFCKTTGGKGLHVVTPLSASERLDWPHAKSFAQAVCAQMAADAPATYLIIMAKRLRAGRIFLDYLRNDAFATAIAPLSPRARPGAPVSMPLEWSQVRAGLDPARFTLRTVPRLLAARPRLWSEYVRSARPLERAVQRLTGTRPVRTGKPGIHPLGAPRRRAARPPAHASRAR